MRRIIEVGDAHIGTSHRRHRQQGDEGVNVKRNLPSPTLRRREEEKLKEAENRIEDELNDAEGERERERERGDRVRWVFKDVSTSLMYFKDVLM